MKTIVDEEKKIAEYAGPDRIVSFEEAQEILGKNPEGFIMHSKLHHLDELIGGFMEGELILVSGRPKSGKTLLLQTITTHLSLDNEKVLWFTYEVPLRQFLSIFPVLPEGYTPLQVEHANIWWLEKKIVEAKVKYGVKFVFIDHIHYLLDMSKVRNPSLEVGEVYRKLKLLAVKHKIVIFVISHIRKTDREQEPQGEDIRDTYLALGEPDTVILIWRVADEQGEIGNDAVVKVVATRRTGVMEKHVKFKKVEGYLVENEGYYNEN